VCVCVGVYVSTIKRKPLIGISLKVGTVVILDPESKPIDSIGSKGQVSGLGLGLELLPADQKLCWNAAGVTEYNSG